MLARRGSRRPVVVGDDRALLRTVTLLHRGRELNDAALSMVPVGTAASVALARGLGVPPDTVQAARTVMGGVEQRLDLLIDESGGVVLGGLRISAPAGTAVAQAERERERSREPAGYEGQEGPRSATGGEPERGPHSPSRAVDGADGESSPWRRACRSLVRTMQVPQQGGRGAAGRRHWLRVEADGELLADLDSAVEEVSVSTEDCGRGMAEVTVRSRSLPQSVLTPKTGAVTDASSGFVRARARTVTVTGRDFHYRADDADCGPVRSRTWTVVPSALRLTLPAVPAQAPPAGSEG